MRNLSHAGATRNAERGHRSGSFTSTIVPCRMITGASLMNLLSFAAVRRPNDRKNYRPRPNRALPFESRLEACRGVVKHSITTAVVRKPCSGAPGLTCCTCRSVRALPSGAVVVDMLRCSTKCQCPSEARPGTKVEYVRDILPDCFSLLLHSLLAVRSIISDICPRPTLRYVFSCAVRPPSVCVATLCCTSNT